MKKPKEILLPILVHTCKANLHAPLPLEKLERETRYIKIQKTKKVKDLGAPAKLGQEIVVQEREVIESVCYLQLPKSCRCRKYVRLYEANEAFMCNYAAKEALANGSAMPIYKVKGDSVQIDENCIWMPIVRERVPRIDLITKADIERSVIGSERKSKFYRFNRDARRFERIMTPPEGTTLVDWLVGLDEEIRLERQFRKRFKQYIEECHWITLEARAELMAPFRPDPFEGRPLFW